MGTDKRPGCEFCEGKPHLMLVSTCNCAPDFREGSKPTADMGTDKKKRLTPEEENKAVATFGGMFKMLAKGKPSLGPTPSPLARAAVGEFEKLPKHVVTVRGEHTVDMGYVHAVDKKWLLATLSRVEAAARREEKERVWKLAHAAAYLSKEAGYEPTPTQVIQAAAGGDGVDLTSLAKPE